MKTRSLLATLPLGLGVLAALVLLNLLSTPPHAALAQAGTGVIRVAKGGSDALGCGSSATPCASVQYAVDQAAEGDEVRIATGVYTGVNGYGGLSQIVYLSKTLTLRGGYTTTNWNVSNPISYPTTLDAQGQGRVLYITGDISPTVEGLQITGGDADGLGGGPYVGAAGAGGGMYIISATAAISNNQLFDNIACYGGGLYSSNSIITLTASAITSSTSYYQGGGMYLLDSDATLNTSTIRANTSGRNGGGLHLRYSNAILNGNTISFNTVTGTDLDRGGGGLHIEYSSVTLNDNTITANTTNTDGGIFGGGGGVYLRETTATFKGNTISDNAVRKAAGGGVYVIGGTSTFDGNIISDNAAELGSGVLLWANNATLTANTISGNTAAEVGGGLLLQDTGEGADVTLTKNIISDNAAVAGGGLALWTQDALIMLNENIIMSNTAYYGGGLFLETASATLTNTIIANNRADVAGSGLWIGGSSPRLLHTTIARNRGGDGSGIYVTDDSFSTYSDVAMTNTILISQAVGISVTAGNTVTLEATLWGTATWANGADWGGAGAISTGTVNLWGDPVFLDPDAGDYHIGSGSAARDAGVNANVTIDIDGNPRPIGAGFDLGADEFPAALKVSKRADPNPVQAGATLSYTLQITNTGDVTLHATISDTLPHHVAPGETPSGTLILPGGLLAWTATIPAPGGVWTKTVALTVEMGYAGPLTNVVQVMTEEGATGVYTETVEAQVTPALTVTKQATPDPVQAGAQVTYTLRLTNTGNVGLNAIISDTLPSHIALGETPSGTLIVPGGVLTWTATIPAPGGVWSETVALTVEMGYAGPLTNVVQVTTEEGATGVYTETVEAQVTPALIVTKQATPDPVQAGAQVTYTLRLTNTGNVDLNATISDTLPFHIAPGETPSGTWIVPGGVLTWTEIFLAPGGVWSETIKVSAEVGYAGPLVNVVKVTTEEGVTGVYTETITVITPPNRPPYGPSQPTPTDNATGVPLTQTLHWQGGDPDGDLVTYTIALRTAGAPPTITQVLTPSYDPGLLASDTVYSWTITATDGMSASFGPTWRFTTVGPDRYFIYLPLVIKSGEP